MLSICDKHSVIGQITECTVSKICDNALIGNYYI